MKEIPLTQGYTALVDDADYYDLIQFNWCAATNKAYRSVYAYHMIYVGSKRTREYMHTRITGYKEVDHEDGNGINNCRSNLRPADSSLNHGNQPKYRGRYSSKYKGVSWNKQGKVWHASAQVNKKQRYLGAFADEEEAARAYDRAAIEAFGEYAYTNFPREEEMSQETITWLNTYTLIGDTDKRGTAWHYRQGSTNHFPGAIPMQRVEELICPWEPTRQPLFIKMPDGSFQEVPNFIGMASEKEPTDIYAIHSAKYEVHPFRRWLIENVQSLVDDDNLHCSSALVLAKGSVACVELAITDTMMIEGFPYRPHLLALTSSNGRFETSYGLKVQASVCDNTVAIADREQGSRISFRHTAGSVYRIKDVAEATGLILSAAGRFDEEVRELLSWKVPPKLFSRYLDLMIPEKAKDGSLLSPAAQSRVEKKRDDMNGMWNGDPRVSPWNGTAFGVMQLNNTWQHHMTGATSRTGHRIERNMLNAISGETESSDKHALGVLRGLSDAYGYHVPEQFQGLRVPELVRL